MPEFTARAVLDGKEMFCRRFKALDRIRALDLAEDHAFFLLWDKSGLEGASRLIDSVKVSVSKA